MLGFYDSGLGGLTILEHFLPLFPAEKMIYLGDNLHCPLGDKTVSEIEQITKQGLEFLVSKGCQNLILACNTATVTTLPILQKSFPSQKIIGVGEPILEFLEQKFSPSSRLIFLATKATVESGFFQENMQKQGFENVFSLACVGLAENIEQENWPEAEKILNQKVEKNLSIFKQAAAIVLACTHYPLASNLLQKILQKKKINHKTNSILLLSQGEATAHFAREVFYTQKPEKILRPDLEKGFQKEEKILQQAKNPSLESRLQIYTTANPEQFAQKIERLFGLNLPVSLAKISEKN